MRWCHWRMFCRSLRRVSMQLFAALFHSNSAILLYVKSSVWSVREAASMHDSAFHFRFKLKLHRKQQSIACLFVSPLLLCFQCCSCSYHHYYILIFNTAHSFTGIWSLMDNFCSIQTYSITSDSCLGCQYCSASLLFLKCIYRGEKAAGQG